MIVVDASVAMAWCFEDERTEATDGLLRRVLADGGVVPPLWFAEVTHVLLVADRRGRISRADAVRFVDLLERLPLEVTEVDPPMSQVLDAARTWGLSAYDATYLVCAMREGAALATLDADLRTAATGSGVEVLPPAGDP